MCGGISFRNSNCPFPCAAMYESILFLCREQRCASCLVHDAFIIHCRLPTTACMGLQPHYVHVLSSGWGNMRRRQYRHPMSSSKQHTNSVHLKSRIAIQCVITKSVIFMLYFMSNFILCWPEVIFWLAGQASTLESSPGSRCDTGNRIA